MPNNGDHMTGLAEWRDFLSEGRRRFLLGIRRPRFVIHTLVFVILIGGLGPIISLIRMLDGIEPMVTFTAALAMYSLTLVSAAFADSVLGAQPGNGTLEHEQGHYRMDFPFTCAFVVAAAVSVTGITLSYVERLSIYSVYTSILSAMLALSFWWQVNAPNEKWGNDYRPDSAKGNPDEIDTSPDRTDGWKV